VRSLEYCRRERGLKLYAYVVMENHVHLVAAAPELARVMQAFKGFTAREIVAWAQRSGKSWLLQQFSFHCKAHKSASTHQVWQEGFHPQLLDDADIFMQKVDYIHNNPVLRGYVDEPDHWRYSSARNWYHEDHAVLRIDDIEGVGR
jgi:REP element-mobilizing transposase RayT